MFSLVAKQYLNQQKFLSFQLLNQKKNLIMYKNIWSSAVCFFSIDRCMCMEEPLLLSYSPC